MAENGPKTHISGDEGKSANGEMLGLRPIPRKEGMPCRLLMARRPADLGYDPSLERRGCHVAC